MTGDNVPIMWPGVTWSCSAALPWRSRPPSWAATSRLASRTGAGGHSGLANSSWVAVMVQSAWLITTRAPLPPTSCCTRCAPPSWSPCPCVTSRVLVCVGARPRRRMPPTISRSTSSAVFSASISTRPSSVFSSQALTQPLPR